MTQFRTKGKGSNRKVYPVKKYKQQLIIPKQKLTKPKIEDVKPGMVFIQKSRQFNKTNYARVTKRPYINKPGDSQDIFYAVFVDPNNYAKKRLPDDREFAVWDFNYSGKHADDWKRVK